MKEAFRCKPGPWGDLEYYYLNIGLPERIAALWPEPPRDTVWHFEDHTPDQVRALIRRAGLPAHLQGFLDDESCFEVSENLVAVRPPPEVILGMPPEMRRILYLHLRKSHLNGYYRDPAYIESGDVREWFSGADLPEWILVEIEKLAYPLGRMLAFSDISFVLRGVANSEERREIAARVHSFSRGMVLRLRLSPSSNPAEYEAYWTNGFKNKDILPILRSVMSSDGVERLDVAHLLPPGPRSLLNTFPSSEYRPMEDHPDCHWTSANFFLEIPSDRFRISANVYKRLEESYEPVAAPYRYGDVLMVLKDHPEGKSGFATPVHSFVFIADDIVYTKNGKGITVPWILSRIDDVIARYDDPSGIRLQGFRLK